MDYLRLTLKEALSVLPEGSDILQKEVKYHGTKYAVEINGVIRYESHNEYCILAYCKGFSDNE